MIEIKNLSKTFSSADGTVEALKNVSISIPDGDIFGIIGMSGAGKSTLVRCINMLERPSSGTVTIDGCDLSTLSDEKLRHVRREISMIFQGFHLLMQRNCLRNVCFPLELAGVKKAEAKKRAGSNYPNLSFGVEDATAQTFADGTFDCVVISNALHIMPEPEKALAEIRRVLRTGGKLYAPTFVYQTDRRYFFPRLFALAGFKVYHRRTEAQLLSLIEEAGFEIAQHEVMPSGISEVAYIAGQKK